MKKLYFLTVLMFLFFCAGLFRHISLGILLLRTIFSAFLTFALVYFLWWLWGQYDKSLQQQKHGDKKNPGQVDPDLVASLSQDHKRGALISSKLGLPLRSDKS